MVFGCILREIEHRHVVSAEISADEFQHKRQHKLTKQALNTFEVATELYMAELIPKCHF